MMSRCSPSFSLFLLLLPLVATLTLTSLPIVESGTPDDWSSRTIYQIVTDRFAQGNSTNTGGCGNLKGYCGGTFDGIIAHLDYILDLGFDAIWISPVVANIGDNYHGYAAQNLYEINPHFGGADGLRALINAAHDKNMYVMVGVVANHMGIPPNYDFSQLVPFNDASHYHGCDTCPQYCSIQDFNNQPQVETCRLDGLPDLNQDNPYVHDTLCSWVQQLVSNYSIDGLRIDTIPEVNKKFWPDFQNAAGVYAVGEVFNGDINYVAPYSYALDAVLSYPLYFNLRNVFQSQQSMRQLESSTQSYPKHFRDINVLGTFVDNHDNPRFLSSQGDYQLYKAALTYTLLSTGIPIIYYGSEQGFNGGGDPYCREPLWTTGFARTHPLYKHIQTVVTHRKNVAIWKEAQIQRYADDQFYAFTRGDTLVALTNVGQNGSPIARNITYQSWDDGTQLCSIFNNNDCITVQNNQFGIYLEHGETKVYTVVQHHKQIAIA